MILDHNYEFEISYSWYLFEESEKNKKEGEEKRRKE